MSLPPEVVGRIRLAKFLSLSLKRYENEINKIESLDIFHAFYPDIITFEMFPRVSVSNTKKRFIQSTLAKIKKEGKIFSISYRSSRFAGEYYFCKEKLRRLIRNGKIMGFQNYEVEQLERKLRLVSTRNRIMYMTLLGIIEHQESYIKSSNPLELIPLSQLKLSKWIKNQGFSWIDNSMLSRIINNVSVLMPDDKLVPLKDFFPSTREICKWHIKKILRGEEVKLKTNEINRPYTDEEIKDILKVSYGINISKRTVSYCRNQMGIPPFNKRSYNNRYPPSWAQFSPYFSMTLSSVKENVPELSGVYELSVEKCNIEYPLGSTGVFYIGSSKNIRNRLKTHLGYWSRNKDLKTFLNGSRCFLQVFYNY